MVRIRIKCKNPGRILRERIVEMEDKLFLIQFKAEGWEEKTTFIGPGRLK